MTPTDILQSLTRPSVQLRFSGTPGTRSRFGGRPDLPPGFAWPTFHTATFDDFRERDHSLGFLLQIDCSELPADCDPLLPRHGLLSFFYEMESQRWGYDPQDAGCCRVFWFEDPAALCPADIPGDLAGDFRFPPIGIRFVSEATLPDASDFALLSPDDINPDAFDEARASLGVTSPANASRLSGWPDTLQGNMTTPCELISRGHYLGGSWESVTAEEQAEADRMSPDAWRLLLQLDTVKDGDFELVFGDCGRIYFYIRREDLAARRFDRVWLILQCG